MVFQKNISLKKYTTFRIGGRAKYFFIAKTKSDLIKAIQEAKTAGSPFFILGGGSNLLVSDKGFKGTVIKAQNTGYEINHTKIYAEAGMNLGQLVNIALQNSLSGLEWATGIPGTVGGALFGNAGAFSQSMGDNVTYVEVFDVQKNIIRKFSKKDCRFNYRQSFFKENKNFIILACEISLKKGDPKEMKEKMQDCIDYRQMYHPKGYSAGSVFVNPKGYSAKELIEICGLSGKKSGRACISKQHANFIINQDRATAKNVLKLIADIKKSVHKKSKVTLQEEIIFLE